MVLDHISQAASYRGLGPRLAAGLDWIARFASSTPDGRYDIHGNEVYALVQSYDTAPAADKKYESHRAYADIQYVAAGTEVIHYAPAARLQPATAYDPDKDYLLYADPAASTPLLLERGNFAIFYPADGHKPGCVSGTAQRMKKVVIKVRI